jgi:hypothetical protein
MPMSMTKSRLLASGLAVGGLCAAVALGYAAPYLSRSLLQQASTTPPAAVMQVADKHATADVGAPADVGKRNVTVSAPYTQVDVSKDNGNVAVSAPYTNVRVNPDKGQVRVRAPYVNLDIRW